MDNPYSDIIWQAWKNETVFTMPFHGDGSASFRIDGMAHGYDVADLVCVGGDYEGEKQSVSLTFLESVLRGDKPVNCVYRYINRWYDDEGTPHYHGIYAKYPTTEEAQKLIKFNLLDVPVDIVYQALDEDDMWSYLRDMNRNADSDEIE